MFNASWVPGPVPVNVGEQAGGWEDDTMEDEEIGGMSVEQIRDLLEKEYGGNFPVRDAVKYIRTVLGGSRGDAGTITQAERAVAQALPYLPHPHQEALVASLQGA
jgi:hypothetical protein